MKKPITDKDGQSSLTRLRMARVIASAIDSLEQNFRARNVKLKHRRPRSIHFVFSDRGKLIQVVRNLLQHALDFTGNGGEIRISESKLNGRRRADKTSLTKISITVGGKGVSEDMLNVISHKFQQIGERLVDSGNNPDDLKLSLCREFIREAGGNIWVKNEPGKSLTFNFTLPLIKEIQLKSNEHCTATPEVRVVETAVNTTDSPELQVSNEQTPGV